MVRESESLFAKRLSVGVKIIVYMFFFLLKHWNLFHIEVILMCCMGQSVQKLASKAAAFYVDVEQCLTKNGLFMDFIFANNPT